MKYIKQVLLLLAVLFLITPASCFVNSHYNGGSRGVGQGNDLAIQKVFVTGNANSVPAYLAIHTITRGNAARVESIVTDPTTGEVVGNCASFCRNKNCICRVEIPYEGNFDVTVTAYDYRGGSVSSTIPNAISVALPVMTYGRNYNVVNGVTYLPNNRFSYGGVNYYSNGYPVYQAGNNYNHHAINRNALALYRTHLREASHSGNHTNYV